MVTANFKTGVGRLVTDRFDFENHITGKDFTHTAVQIKLSPTVDIDGYISDNLQSSIDKLGSIYQYIIPNATATVLGGIKLTKDLGTASGGTALLPMVTGLQGYPVSNITPSTNDYLFCDGSKWLPAGLVAPNPWVKTLLDFNSTGINIKTTKYNCANVTTINTAATLYAYTLQTNSSVSVIGTLLGRNTVDNTTICYTVALAISTNTGSPNATIITATFTVLGDEITGVTAPSLVSSGKVITIKTGCRAVTTINWTLNIEVHENY